MTVFLRLLSYADKSVAIKDAISAYRSGEDRPEIIEANVDEFKLIPGSPYSYWVSQNVRRLFLDLNPLEGSDRRAAIGLSTKYDARFVRAYWEIDSNRIGLQKKWARYANGSKHSKHYVDYYVMVNADQNFRELREYISWKFPYLKGNTGWILHDENEYGKPVIGWPLRTGSFSPHILPREFVFSARTYGAFVPQDQFLALHALLSSCLCDFLIKLSLGQSEGQPEFVTNAVRVLPIPHFENEKTKLEELALRAWHLARLKNIAEETSHAFTLPIALQDPSSFVLVAIEEELTEIQEEIDEIAAQLYGLSEADMTSILGSLSGPMEEDGNESNEDDEDDEIEVGDEGSESKSDSLMSWAIGVTFGRFDWRLATGERAPSPEPDPFDPLPAKSPGMLPDGDEPFHAHPGILVDDQGHLHDLSRLVEEVLARVNVPVPEDVRRWLQKDFFPFHLQRYSKSRRKAPIYWPLSTTSGSYTLWVYYPSLSSQTLYTAINDFVEPKLKQVETDLSALRNKGSNRTRDDEKQFESLQGLASELAELRGTLLQIAPTYKPNHDDGVQISAAPLWPLFRHKPWQKVLKDTWAKLEKGDYDWAHLAMNYWPERVREKCKHDKSLAIAHDLEALYIEPPAKPKKAGGRKKKS